MPRLRRGISPQESTGGGPLELAHMSPAAETATADRPRPSELLAALPTSEERRPHALALSVLIPVYNERHLVTASVNRVLALKSDRIARLEVVIVDDRSKDGSWEVLQRLAASDDRIKLVRHEKNQGKGAALRTALEQATGDVCIVHDADMEYNPADIPAILEPFIEEGADAVFGSRYISAQYRRALMFRHTLINRTITGLTNWLTDLDLTDVETCYKAINTRLLKSLPLRSNDFRFEIEITMKLAKRRARIFEVPIRYLPRSFEEGKKIRSKDGILALRAMVTYSILDDLYREDEVGAGMVRNLQNARRFNQWLGSTLRPLLGDRVLEIGAGAGSLTSQFIPRDLYVATETNPTQLDYLAGYSLGKPYLRVVKVDPLVAADFDALAGQFDTVVLVSVLERSPDPVAVLRNATRALMPGGKIVILTVQQPALRGTIDTVLGYQRRYTRDELRATLEAAGLRAESMFDFNRASAPGWLLNSRVFKQRAYTPSQLKLLEIIMPTIRRIDRFLPWAGLNLGAVAVTA